MRDFLFLTPRWLPVGRGRGLTDPKSNLAARGAFRASRGPRGLLKSQSSPPRAIFGLPSKMAAGGLLSFSRSTWPPWGLFPWPTVMMATAPALCPAYHQDGYHGNPFPGLLSRRPSSSAYNQDGRQEGQLPQAARGAVTPSPPRQPPHPCIRERLFLFLRLQGGGAILGEPPPGPSLRQQETPRLRTPPPSPNQDRRRRETRQRDFYFILFLQGLYGSCLPSPSVDLGGGAEPWGAGAEPWGAGSCTHF
ncbi:semaphorin-3F-like [Platysternon megacephalum]|uniref:Semaphorin-3F-like n=1 Tax=Platysternon megacephalum TaxID=55544 RepID=A0A4D9DMC6_9SAUR|nr:semaphorin-3F-like [Platysternon megacephalum]